MEKIKITVCSGTACYLLGASELLLLEEEFTPEQWANIEMEVTTCLGYCTRPPEGLKPPYAVIDGEIIGNANAPLLRELALKRMAERG